MRFSDTCVCAGFDNAQRNRTLREDRRNPALALHEAGKGLRIGQGVRLFDPVLRRQAQRPWIGCIGMAEFDDPVPRRDQPGGGPIRRDTLDKNALSWPICQVQSHPWLV